VGDLDGDVPRVVGRQGVGPLEREEDAVRPGVSKTCVTATVLVAPVAPAAWSSTGTFWRGWLKSSTKRSRFRFSGEGVPFRTVASKRIGRPTTRLVETTSASVMPTFV